MDAETVAALIFGMVLAVAIFFPVIAWQIQKLIRRLADG